MNTLILEAALGKHLTVNGENIRQRISNDCFVLGMRRCDC